MVGLGMASFGAVGRAWATCYISGQKQKHLVTTGPYSLSRNPLYLFSIMLGVGLGFCTGTLTAPAILLAVLAILSFFQIRQEEHRLRELFGEKYEDYMSRVPRFFPSFHSYIEPDEITIEPRLLKRGLFGIAFLLILIGAVEVIQALHRGQFLPDVFHIY